jgi:hypothetical protein
MVFATAHKHPASTAHTSRCGALRTSARTEDVPKISAGTLHRARKTPITMISEITIGEIPTVTNLVGASAAPNHAPAVKPDKIPSSCNFLARELSCAAALLELINAAPTNSPQSTQRMQKQQPAK